MPQLRGNETILGLNKIHPLRESIEKKFISMEKKNNITQELTIEN